MIRWGRLKIKAVLGAGVAIMGTAILIMSLPSWVCSFIVGGALIWIGLLMIDTFR